jgi:hypothetical protein
MYKYFVGSSDRFKLQTFRLDREAIWQSFNFGVAALPAVSALHCVADIFLIRKVDAMGSRANFLRVRQSARADA